MVTNPYLIEICIGSRLLLEIFRKSITWHNVVFNDLEFFLLESLEFLELFLLLLEEKNSLCL